MRDKAKSSVLIVDDERANIITLTHILSPEYTVYAAKNGQDAIEVAKRYIPDVILLDILMPEMDGYEALSHLKKIEEIKNIPVIIITGLTDAEDEERGLDLGAADYISKPLSPAIVRLRIKSQIQIINQIRIINQRLGQQTLMSKISQSFLSGSDMNAAIRQTLKSVGEFMGVPQILLCVLEEDGSTLTCRHEWLSLSLGFGTRVGGSFILDGNALSIIYGTLCVSSNDKSIKGAMAPYRKNFHSYITTPIFIKGKLYALIDFSRKDDGRAWSESDLNLAILVAGVITGVYERAAMEKQTSIVENSPQAIIYIAADRKLSYANPAASELTGYTHAEIMSEGFRLVFDAETLRMIHSTFLPNALQNGCETFEANMKRKDGGLRILTVTCFAAGDGTAAAIAHDITGLRELEGALVTAKEAAERSSRAKGEFLSRMSHEMRTPMNAIMGMTQIANISRELNVYQECLAEIDTASRQMLALIDDMLDMNAVDNKIMHLERLEFSFIGMMDGVLRISRQRMKEKSHTFRYEADPAIPDMIIGDERRLAQVFGNILSNAAKFTPSHGAIGLKVCLLGENESALTLKAEFTDNGIGIPKDRQNSIFEFFEQVDGGFTRAHGGVGLGLPISKHIIEMMGGKIEVGSEPGKGCVFTVTFPVERSTDNGPAGRVAADKKGGLYEGKAALLVEDLEINRYIITTMLEDTQLKIECAEDGKRAVEMVEAAPDRYNIILMDISMPVMDGWEATRRIRALPAPESAGIPIIAVTAHTDEEDIRKCSEAGMNAHLGKPVEANKLLETLSRYIG